MFRVLVSPSHMNPQLHLLSYVCCSIFLLFGILFQREIMVYTQKRKKEKNVLNVVGEEAIVRRGDREEE